MTLELVCFALIMAASGTGLAIKDIRLHGASLGLAIIGVLMIILRMRP